MVRYDPIMGTSLLASRAAWWLIGMTLAFAGFGLLYCAYLASWDAEWSYLTLGKLALQGRIGLFQDELGGERLPLPFYVIGLSQVVAGPSLLAARVTSLGLGAAALVFGIRMVAVVLHLNAPQPFRLGEPR